MQKNTQKCLRNPSNGADAVKKFKPTLWIILALVVSVPVIGPTVWQQMSTQAPESNVLLGTLADFQNSAKWVSITGEPQDIALLGYSETGDMGQALYFKMPGFYLEQVMVGTIKCSRVTMPQQIMFQTEGLPEVPVMSRSILVPPGSKTTLKIVEHKTRQIKMDPVIPSLGHLTRDINPLTVEPRFDEFYKQNEVWPKTVVELGKAFTLREYNGVNIRFFPLRYDAGKGLVLVTEKLVVDIITEYPDGIIKTVTAEVKPGSQPFQTVYQRVFGENLPASAMDKYEALPSRGRMLIIAHESLAPAMSDFVTWKQQLGIDVDLRTTAEVGNSATTIRTAIADKYKEDAGLTWVILVGDQQLVATDSGGFDGSDSDSRYAMIDGADLYPDVFISRISANNTTQLLTQLNKFIAYEKTPSTGSQASWYQRGVGIASDEGSPTDTERAQLLRTDLLNYGFHTVDGIYQGQGGNSLAITTALNEGASVVNYLGHGSGTSWGSVYFSRTQVHNLDNGPHWPWIVDVSCSNGDFGLDECLAEAWMRAGTPETPQGAVGIISASSLAPWVPPTVMQAEVIDLITNEVAFTLGALYYSGLMKVLDEYTGVSVAEQVIDQNVVFGDCSLMVRTATPGSFSVSGPEDLSSAASVWSGIISGPEGSVATLTWDGILYGVGFVGAGGSTEISLTSSLGEISQIQLTVSGFNMIPLQDLLSIDGGDIIPTEPEIEEEVEDGLPAHVHLRGNFPNPFNPSTHIAFDLPRDMNVRISIYDIRGHMVKILVDESLSAGSQEILWDGSDSRGGNVSSGIYLYRLETPEGMKAGRMTLTK